MIRFQRLSSLPACIPKVVFQNMETFYSARYCGLFLIMVSSSLTIGTSQVVEIKLNTSDTLRFIECGIPPSYLDYFIFNKTFSIGRSYEVIKPNLKCEDNVHIKLENLKNTTFYFFGVRHPDAPNYKIHFVDNVFNVMFCPYPERCEKPKCNMAILKSENRSLNQIYISWKLEDEITTILVQTRSSLVKCDYLTSRLRIQKLVVLSGTKQNIFLADVDFQKHTQNGKIVLTDKNFELPPNRHIMLNVFTCLTCEATFILNCWNFSNRAAVTVSRDLQILFRDSTLQTGWVSVKLPNKTSSDKLLNCSIERQTQNNEELTTNSFWIQEIEVQIAKLEDISESTTRSIHSTTTAMAETSTPTRNGNLKNESLYQAPLIVCIILCWVLWYMCCKEE